MYRSFGIFGLSAALLVAAASCSRMQSFELSGRIDGLQVGDTLRFERVLLPEWNYEPAFDVVVGEAGAFAYRGEQAHDGYYSMTYHPKVGEAVESDRRGKSVIVTDGDRITLTGTAEEIYYCTLGGGIYDEPALAGLLAFQDSLGRIRGSYLRNAREAMARGDKEAGREWSEKFNRFRPDDQAQRSAYEAANPQGSLYLLVDRIPTVAYRPLTESRAFYEALSGELKASYFGGVYADFLQRMESLAVGQPAPDFLLVTTRGEAIAKADFAGEYLLFYHWGLCPGSIWIDGQVRDLYAAYKDRGLRMVGLTESVDMIRRVYEGLPDDESAAGMRSALAGMLAHGWPEIEVETDRPENGRMLERYAIEGWPAFVLIAPDGTIAARGYTEAFFKAKEILAGVLGGTHPE
ncbi:peroxiredoxin family protein [Alistipes communis]|uniref:peroxiredoxin family protein n=1 Tax=Alistipes communis TaxID=2585118 RepID=UPI003AF95381